VLHPPYIYDEQLLSVTVECRQNLSIEGPEIPDVRNAEDKDTEILDNLIDTALKEWLKQPRRL